MALILTKQTAEWSHISPTRVRDTDVEAGADGGQRNVPEGGRARSIMLITQVSLTEINPLLRFTVSWFLEPPHGINVSMVWWHRRYSILHM